MQESAAPAEPGAGQPHRRLTDSIPTNQGEVARRPDQWAECLTGVGRAGGQAGEEPAPARGAAWPGAAGKPGLKGRGVAGKAAGPGPAVPISARLGSAARGARDDAWDQEGRRGAGAPLLSPPGAAPATAAPWGLLRPSPLWARRTASAWLGGGSRSETRRRVGDGCGGLATAPPASPDSRGRKGPCSSLARPPALGAAPAAPQPAGSPPTALSEHAAF